jgi:hypothetical protein
LWCFVGIFEKLGCFGVVIWWCGGVVVGFCVVDVAIKQSSFVVTKDVTRILDLFFFGLPVLGMFGG